MSRKALLFILLKGIIRVNLFDVRTDCDAIAFFPPNNYIDCVSKIVPTRDLKEGQWVSKASYGLT